MTDSRAHRFPVTTDRIFLAHAAVTALPRCAVEAMERALQSGMHDQQENEGVFRAVEETRAVAARLIHAQPEEIALLGPTALGLNLVANGLDWKAGDEVVFYQDDYPANVYPWQHLAARGVRPVPVRPAATGQLTPDLVFSALTPRTRLVALASCHFLTGYRLDYQAIGQELRRRGILFCLDAIQSLGATELDSAHFDFLSADSHKWLLGPIGAGIFFVRRELFDRLPPTLLGSWNVQSPRFIAQPEIRYEPSARRYEPGSLYAHGILGMRASMEMLLAEGLPHISARLQQLHACAAGHFRALGFTVLADAFPVEARTGIVTLTHAKADLVAVFQHLQENRVNASLRWDRAGRAHLRFSPHFYNTEEELARVAELMRAKL